MHTHAHAHSAGTPPLTPPQASIVLCIATVAAPVHLPDTAACAAMQNPNLVWHGLATCHAGHDNLKDRPLFITGESYAG